VRLYEGVFWVVTCIVIGVFLTFLFVEFVEHVNNLKARKRYNRRP
jgi:hypothetical protein